MRKPDPVEQALSRLSALRGASEPAGAIPEVRACLGSRVNLVAAKAAKLAGEFGASDLVADLVGAFHRFFVNPKKLDKGCAAITEIVTALYRLDYLEPEIYLTGIRHVQFEPSFGKPVDAAAKLRAQSALGLVRTRHAEAMIEVTSLLADPEPQARIGAVRALATNGGEAGALLLRLKTLTGDPEAEVLGECFAGLLALTPEKSLSFVARYLDSETSEIGEAAALALGGSRQQGAFEILKKKWERTALGPLRSTLLLAIATVRQDAAVEFLLSLLETGGKETGIEVLAALSLYRDDTRIRNSVEAALSRRGDRLLADAFESVFAGQSPRRS